MKKNVTAILLVFALLAGFASCRKLEDSEGFVIESKAYIVDSEGVTRDVQSIINDDGKTMAVVTTPAESIMMLTATRFPSRKKRL